MLYLSFRDFNHGISQILYVFLIYFRVFIGLGTFRIFWRLRSYWRTGRTNAKNLKLKSPFGVSVDRHSHWCRSTPMLFEQANTSLKNYTLAQKFPVLAKKSQTCFSIYLVFSSHCFGYVLM